VHELAHNLDDVVAPDTVGVLLSPPWTRQLEAVVAARAGDDLAVRRREHRLRARRPDVDNEDRFGHAAPPSPS
jgi:hypothetical protein